MSKAQIVSIELPRPLCPVVDDQHKAPFYRDALQPLWAKGYNDERAIPGCFSIDDYEPHTVDLRIVLDIDPGKLGWDTLWINIVADVGKEGDCKSICITQHKLEEETIGKPQQVACVVRLDIFRWYSYSAGNFPSKKPKSHRP